MVTATINVDVDICVHTSADEESTYNDRASHTLPSCPLGSPEPESTTNEDERASERERERLSRSSSSSSSSRAVMRCDPMRRRPASSVPANVKEVTRRPSFQQKRQTNRAVAVAQYHRAGGRRSTRQRRLKAEKLTCDPMRCDADLLLQCRRM
jgi:hypothetical protein